MTTHDKDKIIAAALKIGISISTMHGQELHKLMPISDAKTLEAFYAIAFEAGRQAEREACAKVCDMSIRPTMAGLYDREDAMCIEIAETIRARGNGK